MHKVEFATGTAAVFLGLIYVGAFIYFGVVWAYPYSAEASAQLAYLADNHFWVSAVYFWIYIVFGLVLSILVLGLHVQQASIKSQYLNKLATFFGCLWVGLVIASGMIFVIGLREVVNLAAINVERASDTWHIVKLLTESLGGGNELVGGVWVLLVSLNNLAAKIFSRWLNYIGLFVGAAGIATVYPADVFTEIFGVSQIVWFIWLGISFIGVAKTGAQGHTDAQSRGVSEV